MFENIRLQNFATYLIDIFNSLLLMSRWLALASSPIPITYLSLVYLKVQAKVTLKVSNKNV